MSISDLVGIQRTFTKCLKDIAVFERFHSDGQFFEVNDIQKENKRWLVVAAGIGEDETRDLFHENHKRAQKSLIPLLYKSTCRISFLFVLRPFDQDPMYSNQALLISPFAPTSGIPWVEIRNGYIKILNIPDNDNRLVNLRWEWDVIPALQYPYERWLRFWKDNCGFNPAHPPSHLHLNSDVISSRRSGELENELRLALGRPNPLAFLLSIAVWLRRL